jgi:2-amino-4-hydroxy-6-hydroxymethyldihydropteridine diphosphokinase
MSLIIATGSNVGNSIAYLNAARLELSKVFYLIAASRIYKSAAVDYENQPDFFNQVLEFKLPDLDPDTTMRQLLDIERSMGRIRDIPRGPRTIDIDIIFWGLEKINSEHLTIPHPRWQERSFVVKPIQELPFFQTVKKCSTIPEFFKIDASPI